MLLLNDETCFVPEDDLARIFLPSRQHISTQQAARYGALNFSESLQVRLPGKWPFARLKVVMSPDMNQLCTYPRNLCIHIHKCTGHVVSVLANGMQNENYSAQKTELYAQCHSSNRLASVTR